MRNVVLWKQVFLGASLFLCGTSPVMATEVGDLVPDVRGNALQQDGRRVTCTISDKAGPIVGANVLIKGTTIGNISDMDGRVILDGVPDNTILVVSYIGYVTQEISLKNSQNNIKVKWQKLPKKVIGSHNIILVLLQIGLMTLMDFVILMVNIMYFINIIHITGNGDQCTGGIALRAI